MKCEKCGNYAKFVSQRSVYAEGKDMSYGTEQLYKCETCDHEQKEILFHSSGRYDFASFSQPDG